MSEETTRGAAAAASDPVQIAFEEWAVERGKPSWKLDAESFEAGWLRGREQGRQRERQRMAPLLAAARALRPAVAAMVFIEGFKPDTAVYTLYEAFAIALDGIDGEAAALAAEGEGDG